MHNKEVKVIRVLVILILIVCFVSACATSSRYIAAPSAPPPDLGINFTDNNLSVSINYLIIPDGPGAWVKGARWDEYVLTSRNMSDKPLTVENIRLVDPRGLYIMSGVDPDQLETLSETLAGQYKDVGISVAIGIAPAVVTGVAVGAGAIGTAVGAAALAPVALIAAPIYYFSKQQSDLRDKENIRKEFTRRQLTTFTLSGNATISSSVFFPIVPNPKALVVDYRVGSDMKVLEISLEKLIGLHVAPSKEEKK
jgi:hypothetical protein